MSRSAKRNRSQINTWPGYVDALAALLILVIFVLLLLTFSQFLLSQALTSKESELGQLNQRLLDLTEQLGLVQTQRQGLQQDVDRLSGMITVLLDEKHTLSDQLEQRKKAQAEQQETLDQQLLTLAMLQADIATLRQLRADLETRVGQLARSLQERERTLAAVHDRAKTLTAQLASAEELTYLAQRQIEDQAGTIGGLNTLVADQRASLQHQVKLGLEANAQVAHLNAQIEAMRHQLEKLSLALDIREQEKSEQQTKIKDLGRRLNQALAREVNRLAQYRSEFFGRLKALLADTQGVQVVGDRFLFQSELLFDSGSATLGPSGRGELKKLAQILAGVAARIPKDIDWILRVDGHTDQRPIQTAQFPSNWELSTARAVSVVRFLVEQGIPMQRLTAAGFAQFHPIDPAQSEAAYRRNRRIELKLTAR